MSTMARPPGGGSGSMLAARTDDEPIEGPRPTHKLRKLLPFFRPYWGRAIATILLTLVVTATGLAGPALAQFAIDDGIRARDKGVLVLAVALFVVAGVIGVVMGAFHRTYCSSSARPVKARHPSRLPTPAAG